MENEAECANKYHLNHLTSSRLMTQFLSSKLWTVWLETIHFNELLIENEKTSFSTELFISNKTCHFVRRTESFHEKKIKQVIL